MQYVITGQRRRITAAEGRNFFKIPEDIKAKLFPLINPKHVITFGGMTPAEYVDPKEGRILQLAKLKKKFGIDDIKNVPVEIAVDRGQAYGKPGKFNRCQLTGEIRPLATLEYVRIYDQLLLVKRPKGFKRMGGFVWLEDKKQFIADTDIKRLNIIKFYGKNIYYCANADWLTDNRSIQTGILEGNNIILTSESKQVIIDGEGTNVYVSIYELENREHHNYNTCVSCNKWVLEGIHRNGVCPRCVSAGGRSTAGPRSDQVYNYSHKVENDLGFDSKGCETIRLSKSRPAIPVYSGVELEFNVDEEAIAKSAKYINGTGYAQCKSDSSISRDGAGAGYEIVTQPCSIIKHKEKLTDILSKWGKYYKAGSTCGIHVHISREPFDESDVGKMLSFLHREANRSFVVALARRESHRYARLTDGYIKANKADPGAIKRGHSSKLMSRERYTALNVKDKTLEFRIFAASTELDVILTCVQFCEAVAMYAKAHTTSPKVSQLPLTKWTDISNFIQFLKDSQIKEIKSHKEGEAPVYEIKQKYAELEQFIITNKLPTSSKNTEEVLFEKVKKSINNNVQPVYRHREIPVKTSDTMTRELLANRVLMMRWLHETTDGRGGSVKYNEANTSWELVTRAKEVLFTYNLTIEKAA